MADSTRSDEPTAPLAPAAPSRAMLFEVAWEVCQQVGGIYTVLRSKAPTMVDQWGGRYCCIGPYNPDTSPLEFEAGRPTGPVGETVQQLREAGLGAHYGRWLVTGTPRTVLLDTRSIGARLAEIKYDLWEHHGISLPGEDALLDGVAAFGYLVQRFFEVLLSRPRMRRPVLAHFHEWLASAAILPLRRNHARMGMVFTTHATLLGRYLAMHDPWFHDHLPFVDVDADSHRFNIRPQYQLERGAAHGAHVLTTVSDVTAAECEHLLGRAPDVILPNGLNIERFVAIHEFQNLHRLYKERIHQLVMAEFFPSYTFDLDHTLYFFTSGRYEYRNKGFDLTLEALARLNAMLGRADVDRTVVFFLITRRPYRAINSEVLRRRAMLEELRRNCEEIKELFAERLMEATARGLAPDYNELVDDYWKLRLRRLIHAWHAGGLPTVVTHDLADPDDEILRQIRYLQLVNRPEDRVKVVYHPDFINSASPLWGMDYDQFVRGCHLGIFPSFYEPWGYTPLECIARGVPAVTSDLSGFGSYVEQTIEDPASYGLYVAGRRSCGFDQSAQRLANQLMDFCVQERRDRIRQRNRVESISEQFDWQVLGQKYIQAHLLALKVLEAGT